MITATQQKTILPERGKGPVEEIFALSEAEQKILRNQTIDEKVPGTILRDFQILLDFIQSNAIGLSGTHHLLPLKSLPVLNVQMSHPVILDLKRPQAKSYPHLQALYLLARISGLATTHLQNGKPCLTLNESVFQSWKKLNHVERYFTLLEAWLLRGDFSILGERQGWNLNVSECLRLLERIPPEGLPIAGNPREEEHIRYSPGLYHLAFLELFGLVSIEHGKPLSGGGWRVLKLYRIPFGDLLFELIKNLQLPDREDIVDLVSYCEKPEAPFGRWQPVFKPFFPTWRQNLAIPKAEFRRGVHIFKVSQGKKAWRRIAIPAEQSLDDLATAILNAFGFDFDHLYAFLYQNHYGKKVSAYHPEYIDADLSAAEVLMGDVPLSIGASMVFHYDFGDDWQFDVLLERIDPADPKLKGSKLLEEQGKAPEQYV